MKIRIYRSIYKNKTDDGTVLSIFQFPIGFIKIPKRKKDSYERYYNNLLETEDKIQHVPPLYKKSYNFIYSLNKQLERLIHNRIYILSSKTNQIDKAQINLELINYYLKQMDIFPSLRNIRNINHVLESFSENYSSLDGLSEFISWWNIYSINIIKKLVNIDESLSNLIMLDNYDRLDIEKEEGFESGYVMNNRINFSEFMGKLSSKSMTIPPRIIKNYNLTSNNKALLHKIILSNQQKFVSDYLNDNTPYRGLLLYHGLGSGKSGASISITNGFKNKKIVILLPASLKINYLQEIEKFGESLFKPNLNWKFYDFNINNKYKSYEWITNNIIKKLDNINKKTILFNQNRYDKYLNFKRADIGTIEEGHMAKETINIDNQLQNYLFMSLEKLGISYELLQDIKTTHNDSEGIWLLNNTFERGDIIEDRNLKKLYKIVKIRDDQIYLANIDREHIGGGKCGLCGALKTSSRTCPLNEKAKNPDYQKHIDATLEIAANTALNASKHAQEILSEIDDLDFPEAKVITPEDLDIDEEESGDIIINKDDMNNYIQYVINQNFTDGDKKSICSQIKKSFNYKYKLCSYNAGAYTVINLFQQLIPNFKEYVDGKTSSQINIDDINEIMIKINRKEIENPFNNKVVVIDEIHNLISLIMPNSESVNFNGGVVFELLARAENVKLVCLSGTPSINDIFEFSILYNIINGLINSYEFELSSKDALISLDNTKIEAFLKKYKLIDRYTLNKNILNVTRIPNNFVKNFDESGEYVGVIKDSLNDMNSSDFINFFISDFEDTFNSYQAVYQTTNIFTIFNGIVDTSKTPEQRIIGGGLFIDEQINTFKNTYIDNEDNLLYPRNFKNNIMGLTSFYNERSKDEQGESIFPTVNRNKINLEMSMYQFIKYCYAREEERKKEKRSRLNKFIKGSTNIKSSFKTQTRQLGIFTFPPDIIRVSKKNRYDVEYIMDEIGKLIVEISRNIQIEFFKTPLHKKIFDKIKELHSLKTKFIREIVNSELLKNYTEDGIFEPNVLLLNYITKKQSIASKDDETADRDSDTISIKIKLTITDPDDSESLVSLIDSNKEFIIRICSVISDMCEIHRDEILAEDEINEQIELIKTKLMEDYLTFNLDLDKESILGDITVDEEYETLLQHQIERLVENDIYLNLNSVVSEESYNLSWLSPKYLSIFKNIVNTTGSVFVYSQYLTAEGIGIFTEVLKKNGFEELKWTRQTSIEDIDTDHTSEWCTIMTNKKSAEGKFIVDTELIPGNLVRWTRLNSESKTISTTHRVIKKTDDKITITKSCTLETMYEHIDFAQFSNTNLIDIPADQFTELSRCRFVLWTGKQTNIQERIDILQRFNNGDNKYGQDCLILLATSSGAEGISLANVRQVHIMEPYWNNVRINQVIGRARRVKSHITLDPEDRNVEVYEYISCFSETQLSRISSEQLESPEILQLINDINNIDESKKDTEEGDDEDDRAENIDYFLKLINTFTDELNQIDKGKSTDEYLTIIAKRKESLLNKFLYLIKESAVDCILNLEENRSSDPEQLSDLECHSPNIDTDNLSRNNGYSYKFNPLIKASFTDDSRDQKEKQTIRDASVKYQILDFTINNPDLDLTDIHLKCILFPLKSRRDIANNTVLYNYYSFFSINFLQEGKKIKIGKFIDSNLELNPEFLQFVKLFSIIDECEREFKEENPEFNGDFLDDDEKLLRFKESIHSLYLNKIEIDQLDLEEEEELMEELMDEEEADEEGTWKCPMCDTVNLFENLVCSNTEDECDMEKADL